MARSVNLSSDGEAFRDQLARAFQSTHVSFLLGSGASAPAIPLAGTVEADVAKLSQEHAEAALRLLCKFLRTVQDPTNAMIQGAQDEQVAATLSDYESFMGVIDDLLSERRSPLRAAQANVFTTNYDLFVEYACSRHPRLIVNDGFVRGPVADGHSRFSPQAFFNSVYNNGNAYRYRVEIPSINLIKLHGSMSWRKDADSISCDFGVRPAPDHEGPMEALNDYLSTGAVVLPQLDKHRTSVMVQTYYDLFRIYANELERENSLLVVFGFSFSDAHILQVTRRALRNPALLAVIFAYDQTAASSLASVFHQHTNVIVVTNGADALNFAVLNAFLATCVRRAAK